MGNNKLKNRAYVGLSKQQIWEKYLKPDLLKIKSLASDSENQEETIDKAAMRDIERSTTVKIINKIIRKVEGADNK